MSKFCDECSQLCFDGCKKTPVSGMDPPRVPTLVEGDKSAILIKVANFFDHFAPAMIVYSGNPQTVAGYYQTVPILDESIHREHKVTFLFQLKGPAGVVHRKLINYEINYM